MKEKIHIVHVPTSDLRASEYNPRKWDKEAEAGLKESIKRYGIVDPILANSAEERKNYKSTEAHKFTLSIQCP